MSSHHESGDRRLASGRRDVAPSWGRAWLAVLTLFVVASCERAPSKSDYVSARVTEMCRGETSEELQACRLAVIGEFSNVPLEELQRRYPAPEPRPRPSCAF